MSKTRIAIAFFSCICATSMAQTVEYKTNPATAAIQELQIANDERDMNWIVNADGSQYTWITDKYGWGLGYFTETSSGKKSSHNWYQPSSFKNDQATYKAGNIQIDVKRSMDNGDLIEEYIFTNIGQQPVSLTDIGIYTPFNDNYPNSKTCISARTHAHIWDGGSAAYINAMHMGAKAPHIGLVLTNGSVKSYEIWERGDRKANSHTRGIIALNPSDTELKPKATYSVSWRVFSHMGWNDFYDKLPKNGSIIAKSNQYIFEKGDAARVELQGDAMLLNKATISLNGTILPVKKADGKWVAETIVKGSGAMRFEIQYGTQKKTHIDCFAYEDFNKLIQERVGFIMDKQQYSNPSSAKNGAYMVYDTETNQIYQNNTKNPSPADRDEGAERLGMGVLLAKQYQLTKDEKIKESLLKYVFFVRNRLQDATYRTWSDATKSGRNRAYNYAWVADFYFQMYKVTGDKQYAMDGYKTMKSMFRQFGYNFYAIGVPIQAGLTALKDAGLNEQYETLRADFMKMGDTYIEYGLNYPSSEVNYEQSIVAPAIVSLTALYLSTGMEKYLNEAKRQMPVLEAFSGFQPSYHLNEVSIRHWDGYWFGKREMWGDTFPHYWSTVTAVAYYNFYLCTKDVSYQKRAENIVRNNLCLFFENGAASCAYLYPYKVDDKKGQFYDPYANDQDWALVNYLFVNKGIF